MSRLWLVLAFCCGVLAVACRGAAGETPPASNDAGVLEDTPAFFDELVRRYRALDVYRDTARLVQVTERPGEEPHRLETRIACTLENHSLSVETPASQVRAPALDVPIRMSPAMAALRRRYNLWLAPHLVLHFAERPLAELRAGVEEGFELGDGRWVDVDGERMVQLALTSVQDNAGVEPKASFHLFVDPQLMLIKRIEGHQRLPDGAVYHITLEITPTQAESAADEEVAGAIDGSVSAPTGTSK